MDVLRPSCTTIIGVKTVLCAAIIVPSVLLAASAFAQIGVDILEKHRGDLQKQAADPAMKREATLPQDWHYALPDGVRTRDVTFYVDGGTPLYGKLFFPKGFDRNHTYPAVVVGHGVNAVAIGIEKYAARFAERGLVSMAIDYRTYGGSGSDLRLLEPDTSTDERTTWSRNARVEAKRTNLNNFKEVEDYRAAVSFLQAEPGVDPDRIGLWGTSNAGGVVLMAAALDARVKVIVAQVPSIGPVDAKAPVVMRPEHVDDAVVRARTGQGAETDGGFSFRTKIDLWGTITNREFRPGALLDRVPLSTKILWLPVEKDELIPSSDAVNAQKAFKGTSQTIVFPYLTHFQAYSYTAFEVGSTLAADWFLKYLGMPAPADRHQPSGAAASRAPAPASAPGKRQPVVAPARALPEGVTARDVTFYSEQIQCHGRLYLPKGFSTAGRFPAVVLAPGWEQTAAAIEADAAELASQGLVAMAIDYRGWGKSGGFLYPASTIHVDDRLRFSQHTTAVRIQRKRLIPDHQVLDIRNAVSWLQGEPGVDRARIGVWGTDRAAGHVIMLAATDARVKAGVAVRPIIAGRGAPAAAWAPSRALLLDEIHRARIDPATESGKANEIETRAALALYLPFQWLDRVPTQVAILFLADATDADVAAAAKALTGPTSVAPVSGGARAAAEWFVKFL